MPDRSDPPPGPDTPVYIHVPGTDCVEKKKSKKWLPNTFGLLEDAVSDRKKK